MDVQTAVRNEIFRLVDSVQPASRYKTLVIDSTVERVFSFCLEKHQLLDRQVANVQIIDTPRQAEEYLEAVYILEGSSYNAECISADFTRQPPRYSGANVFFLPGASNDCLLQLRNSTAGRYLRKLDVANIHILALERNVFSLDEPYANDRLYNLHVQHYMRLLDKIAMQLAGLCQCLGELPTVRYYSSTATYAQHDLPKLLADKLDMHLGKLKEADPESAEARKKGVLLILDRNIDPAAPLLHEFTYQAMAYDTLKFGSDFSYKSKDGSVTGTPDEEDVDWVGLRHLHISRVTEQLVEKLNELKAQNPHFADRTTDVSVSDIRNMMASLPSYVKTKDRMALNLQIATDCMEQVENQKLRDLAEVEQTALLGPDPDSDEKWSLADRLVEIIANPDYTRKNKLRLLMLYIIGRRTGLFREDYERLQKHTGFDEIEIEMMLNLAVFGAKAVKKSLKEQALSSKEKTQTVFYSENPNQQLLFSRYVPGVKNVVEKLINNQLDPAMFPYTNAVAPGSVDNAESSSSLRNPRQRATWAKPSAKAQVKPRIIVFILGGFVPSESRAAYELSEAYPRDVIMGGTDLLTPDKYLTFLSRQRLPRDKLKLPSDGPPKRAPDFLFVSDRQNKTAQAVQPQPMTAPPVATGPSSGATLDKQQAAMGKPEKKRGLFGLKRSKSSKNGS